MRPKPIPAPAQGETDMFRNRLDNMIDMRHELVRLAGLIDWRRFDEAFGTLYAEKGRPGLSTRLMVGLRIFSNMNMPAGFRMSRSARNGSKTPISNFSAERPIFRPSCRLTAPRCRSGAGASAPTSSKCCFLKRWRQPCGRRPSINLRCSASPSTRRRRPKRSRIPPIATCCCAPSNG